MYKIMLADDEGIVIDSLKFIIEKEFGDMCEVRYAKTGRSVIELAEAFRPDIAVMDIQMPGINGIDAMREIRQNNENMIFIVMSAYDKFNYAKEAIKLGVMEYITKPMERTRIIEALEKAFAQIDREKQKRSNELRIKEKLETVVPVIENGLIYNILFQKHFGEDIENYKTILSIEHDYAYMMAIVCGDEQEGSRMTNAVGSGVKMQKHYQEIRENLKGYFQCVVGSVMGNKLAILVPHAEPEMSYNQRIELIEKARELARHLGNKLDCRFRIGIGSVTAFNNVGNSYGDALNALTMMRGSVAHVDDMPRTEIQREDYPVQVEKSLLTQIENGAVDDAMATARRLFECMIKNRDIRDVRLKLLECVLVAEHIAAENGAMDDGIDGRSDYLTEVVEMVQGEQLEKWFVDRVMSICRTIAAGKNEKSSGVIEEAEAYIQKNFGKEISLDDVSREVNISPYYFSKIFKESTGKNFIEYVTEIRIEKAKELLLTSDYSMKEICLMTGYSDPNYFSRAFKKNVGVTPTEYKEKGKK